MTRFLRSAVLILLISFFSHLNAQNLQISGGNSFSAAVCDNQVVFVWGSNSAGTLGINASDVPYAAAYTNTPGSVTRGNVSNAAWPSLTYGNLPAIRQIDAGSGAHILGLSCAKQVWGWGLNDNGQLGRGTTANSPIPSRIHRGAQASKIDATNDPSGIFLHDISYVSGGNNTSFAIEETTGRVLAWGQNDHGQLGTGNNTSSSTPVYVLSAAGVYLQNIVQIEGGDDCTYALDASGNVWSWGLNGGNQLGRTNGGTTVTGPLGTGDPYAARVIQGDPMNNGYSATPTPIAYLTNITQISGGDTHCLALDANGNVWSFGGDWGEGQLGRAGGSVYQNDARKVSRPGLAAYATAAADFLGGGVDGKAIYVAAGQSMSAVVMSNGKVVTFGSRGLFNAGATDQQSGTTITCPGTGDMIAAGSLGDNNTVGCNSTTCNNKATQFSRTPVYVKTGAGVDLTGIKQISDGDAWFYAIDGSGNAYTWGWNRRGELGLGDYSDRCAATAFSFPSGCALSNPCPGQPNLPANFSTCPIFSQLLDSQVDQLFTSWKYNWQYRATPGTGSWTDIASQGTTSGTQKTTIVTSTNNDTYTSAAVGEYRVLVSDNRGNVPFLCAPCPVMKDSITITETPSPYATDGCTGGTSSTYEVTTPAGLQIKWYTTQTGGTALNPSDTDPTISVLNTTAPTTAACGPGKKALFAEDISSVIGTLFATGSLTPTTAQIATGVSCATGSWGSSGGPNRYLAIRPTRNVKLTSVSFYVNNTNGYSITANNIVIYANKLNGSNNEPNTGSTVATITNSTTIPANTAMVISVAMSVNLTANTIYWIKADGPYNEQPYFNCASAATNNIWNTPFNDNTGQNILQAVSAWDNGNFGARGSVFDIKFEAGTGYTCGRILVCQSNTTCTLPVEMLYFEASKNGNTVVLDWATASESNSSHFIVERSSDGSNWAPVGKVLAAGNSNTAVNYSFTDLQPIGGVSYYRLVQVDADNSEHLSSVQTIEFYADFALSIHPNPSKDGIFNVSVKNSEEGKSSIRVYTVLGQLISENIFSGDYSGTLNLSNLNKGVYMVTVVSGNQSRSSSIIIE